MESLITLLRDKRNVRNAEHEKIETEQKLRHAALSTDLEKLKDKKLQATETIVKNLNTITGHTHKINKVVHQSEQCTGLPISNMHHRQTVDFISDAINFVNNQVNLGSDKNQNDCIDACKLNIDVQNCTQSAADTLKGLKSSIDKAEKIVNSVHIFDDEYDDD